MPTNLVSNQGFETGTFANWTVGGTQSTADSTNIGVDMYAGDVNTGNYGVFAGNATQTSLTQTIATVVGVTYTVGFYLDVYQADATNGYFTATFGNSTVTDLQEPSETDAFTHYSASIVATSTATPLTFTFDDPGGFFGFDDASVMQSPACYCPGTRILTGSGPVPVEELAIGDRLVTVEGTVEPIRWIGRRTYAGRFLAGRPDLQPVTIHAGALGPGKPSRALTVSPNHAMFLAGVLVPARALVNGTTIVRQGAAPRVDYIHLELARHAIIFAEDAESETFLDDDSRGQFHNAADYARLYPDAPPPGAFCAPRVEQGLELERIRRSLNEAQAAA